jgi:hypothetical protein
LYTTDEDYTLFFIRAAHMGGAHCLKRMILSGHNTHPADTAAPAAASVADRPKAGAYHRLKHRFIAGAEKTYPPLFTDDRIPLIHYACFFCVFS